MRVTDETNQVLQHVAALILFGWCCGLIYHGCV